MERRLVPQDKGLTVQAKVVCTSEEKIRIYALLPMGRQIFSHFLKSRSSAHIIVTWNTSARTMYISASSCFPWAFLSVYDTMGSGYWSLCLSCVFPQFIAYTKPTCWGHREKKEKALMLWKWCLVIPIISVCYQHWFSHRFNIWHHTDCHVENYLHIRQTQDSNL